MKKITLAIIAAISVVGASSAQSQDDPPPPPANQPDLILKGSGEPVGDDIYGRPEGQKIRSNTIGGRPVSYTIGVQNDGTEEDRIRLRGTGSDRKFRVAYAIGDRNVTAGMRRGIPLALASDESVRIRATVKATRATAGRDARKALRYLATSSGDRSKRDSAASFVFKKKARTSDRG
jgi:hypothetical protein